jgi:mono/diheme cytochrome c family protein
MRNRLALVLAALAAVIVAAPLRADATPDGAALYKAKCAVCHGAGGSGQTAVGKSMRLKALGSPEVQRQNDQALIKIVEAGKGKMPAYKGKLSAAEVKQIVSYVKTFRK